MNARYSSLLIYIAKNIVGVAFSYLISWFVPRIDFAWCLISVVLVLSPEGTDSITLAITRIKANLVGAFTGMLILLSGLERPYNMAAGSIISLFLCDRLKLTAGAKSTLAAMIIVLMHPEGRHLWDSAFERITAVILGCILALIITFIFHSLFKIKTPVWKILPGKEDEKEG
jgi:uncharacterized membrane protein YgaE (UPF0421/DUF939 family)